MSTIVERFRPNNLSILPVLVRVLALDRPCRLAVDRVDPSPHPVRLEFDIVVRPVHHVPDDTIRLTFLSPLIWLNTPGNHPVEHGKALHLHPHRLELIVDVAEVDRLRDHQSRSKVEEKPRIIQPEEPNRTCNMNQRERSSLAISNAISKNLKYGKFSDVMERLKKV